MIYAVVAFIVVLILVRIHSSRPDVSPEGVDELLEGGGMLIDVRTPSEYRSSRFERALNLPLDTLPEALNRLDVPRGTPLLLCCASGMRSAQAKRLLRKAGYHRVYNAGSISRLKG